MIKPAIRMMPFSSIKRWWRSKGFGIHSPFAFYFITRVLRERLPYYAYPEVMRLQSPDVAHRDLLTLFRIVCYFAPEAVTLPAGTPDAVRATLRLADSRLRLTREAVPFQCFFGDVSENDFREQTESVVNEGGVIVIHRPTASMSAIKETMTCGMTFTNGNGSMMVVYVRHDLPRQDFVINF